MTRGDAGSGLPLAARRHHPLLRPSTPGSAPPALSRSMHVRRPAVPAVWLTVVVTPTSRCHTGCSSPMNVRSVSSALGSPPGTTLRRRQGHCESDLSGAVVLFADAQVRLLMPLWLVGAQPHALFVWYRVGAVPTISSTPVRIGETRLEFQDWTPGHRLPESISRSIVVRRRRRAVPADRANVPRQS